MGSKAVPGIDRPTGEILREASVPAHRKYALLSAGRASFGALLRYELIVGCFSGWPGAAGFALRRLFYRFILGRLGAGANIGQHVSLRGATRLFIGDGVFIDDNCNLDARGETAEIHVGPNTIMGRNTSLRSRGEKLAIGAGCAFGSNCIIGTDSSLTIGNDVLIGAFTYLSGGGSHRFDRTDVPIIRQGFDKKGGITVGDGAWIGAHTTVLDGAHIGRGAIVGANALVKGSLPDMSISHGTPARVQRYRDGAVPERGEDDGRGEA